MNSRNTQLQQFIDEEVSKVKGKALPVHASFLERSVVRKVSCKKLHPNPYDEFCDPAIGPNKEIISRYERSFRFIRAKRPIHHNGLEYEEIEPLFVQKIYPDGYMILNGHHRWAAAVRSGEPSLPVRIVNLTQEKDLQEMLKHAKNSSRVTLDLEEVVFTPWRNGKMEKPLLFPMNRIYRERLRLGIPALFSFFHTGGYDIWLYSSGYMSVEYIRTMMRLYHLHITGIITGTGRKGPGTEQTKEALEKMMTGKYSRTVHIDNEAITSINHRTKEFTEFTLEGSGPWSAQIMDIIRMEKKHFAHETGKLDS